MRDVGFWVTLALIATALAAPSGAVEDDLRDEVVLTDGEVLRGRVVQRYDPEELLLVQGGKQVHVAVGEVARMSTVPDRLATFLDERVEGLSLEREWELVGRAVELELPAVARLQAYHVLSLDPEHEGANGFLGHRYKNRRWQWLRGKKFMEREDWLEYHADWGHPLSLESEHYRLRTNESPGAAVDLLMDLERFYLFWFGTFGRELRALEVLDPMLIEVYGDEERFPRLSSAAEPYFTPGSGQNVAAARYTIYTYHVVGDQRPRRLFDLATQQLLYRAGLGESSGGVSGNGTYYRVSAWVEIGLGYWFGSQLGGAPGYAEPRPFVLDPVLLRQAGLRAHRGPLAKGKSELTNLTNLSYQRFHELTAERGLYWAKSRALMVWLMDPATILTDEEGGQRTGRDAVFAYLRQVYGVPTGHSSAILDEALGVELEELEEPWRRWLGS